MLALSLQSLLLGAIAGYFIGSIPFAYIITKRRAGLDLRTLGSRNIGTMNAYEVTGKKSIGSSVFAADFLKGLIPVLVLSYIGQREALLVCIPSLILGHCYPVWLRFKGGRGLASAAGVMLVTNPAMLVLWCLFYLIGRMIKPNVHFAAILATGFCLALLQFLPMYWVETTTLAFTGLKLFPLQLVSSITLLLLIILSRHVEPFIDLIRGRE